jgi:hypothetical protein
MLFEVQEKEYELMWIDLGITSFAVRGFYTQSGQVSGQ